MEFKEQCWFIKGIRIGNYVVGYREYHSDGTSGSVEFDWERAFNKCIFGWFHTHPSGFDNLSSRDEKTMKGWVIAMGRPLLCGIGVDGVEKWWLYSRETNDTRVIKIPVPMNKIGPFVWCSYNVA
jgi:proteasome lid subunit RPN8/RPN11